MLLNMKKKEKWRHKGKVRYMIFGALFGCCFPILALTIDLVRLNLGLSFSSITQIHKLIPVHFIIDSAPFVLGFMAYKCGISYDNVKAKNAQITQTSNYKDNFLASMSHEIRTPMSGIVGVIDLLEKSKNIQKEEQEYLDIIRTSSSDLMNIINDILDLSKLKAGKLPLHPEETDIRVLCATVKSLFMAVSRSQNIDLKLSVESRVPNFLLLDPVRTKQILSNLIGNAIKFSKSGGEVTLKVSCLNCLDYNGNTLLKFEVIDKGIGIQDEQLKSIFSAYNQAGDYSKNHIDGTGLGLFICITLVGLMEGDLGVESEYNKGSNFWFTINVPKVMNYDRVREEKPLLSNTINKNIDLHILMAEDNKMLCKVYDNMFKKFGCQTVMAHDGEALIDVFQEGVYDIILMDINMPKMGGLEALEYLKKNFKNIPPIIGASASALKGDIAKYMSLGFDDYITKPFTIEQVQKKLEHWKPICEQNNNDKKIMSYIENIEKPIS